MLSSAIRKAAILVSCLDRAQADALLDGMPEEQARQVREALLRLEDVDADERDEVIQEFVMRGGSRALPSSRASDGVELAAGLAEQIARGTPAEAPRTVEPRHAAPAGKPFEFLEAADSDRLAMFLRDERPQTVALVLSYLPADQSAQVAAALPALFQAEVLRRLSDLDEASPEVLSEVEQALRERIERDERNRERRSAGLQIVARILDAAGPRLANTWRTALEDEAPPAIPSPTPPVAEVQPAPSALTWYEFERWEPRRAAEAILATPPEISVLAMAGATPGFFQRVIEVMRAEDAKFYRRATSQLRPTRLSDIEAAQAQLAERAGATLSISPIPTPPALVRAA